MDEQAPRMGKVTAPWGALEADTDGVQTRGAENLARGASLAGRGVRSGANLSLAGAGMAVRRTVRARRQARGQGRQGRQGR
jgi:hypothetical protein